MLIDKSTENVNIVTETYLHLCYTSYLWCQASQPHSYTYNSNV